MTLQEYTDSLPRDKQFDLALRLIKLSLPVWNSYADKNKLSYRDTVVGLTHSVDKKLLQNAIDTVGEYLHLNKLEKFIGCRKKLLELRRQFDDPIVALQDTDWELPDEVQKTSYAVYNLIDTLKGKEQTVFGDSTIYVSINQAVDALQTFKMLTVYEINEILNE